MNKKFLTLIFMFVIMCFISVVDVRALTTCNYGIKKNDTDTWQPMIQIVFDSWDTPYINAGSSPLLDNIYTSDGAFVDTPSSDEKAKVTLEYKLANDDRFYMYAKLYSTVDVYQSLNYGCPETIQYDVTMKEDLNKYYHLRIFPDTMAAPVLFENFGSDPDGNHEDAASAYGLENTSGIFILQESANKPLNEFVDVYDCQTYSTYYQLMAQAVKDNDNSCDNNVAFTEKYQQIQNLCTAYRSTEEYYTGNGVSNCQKACSILRDDVANLCGTTPDPGKCGIGGRVLNWIFRIFGIVRYAVPALLIILSVLDYIKAIAADNEDEMKKVTSRFFKRLIAAALIFLLPLILDFILKMFDIPGLDSRNPFCAE